MVSHAVTPPLIGVLALQGAVSEHAAVLATLGARTRTVTRPAHLEGLAGLVMPGGESTAMARLGAGVGMFEAIAARHASGTLPLLGTCAGLILLANEVEDTEEAEALAGFTRAPALDITARRNAYGAQRESFLADLALEDAADPDGAAAGGAGRRTVRSAFIRAPQIVRVGDGVEILARHAGRPVLVRQGDVLAATFHPEITGDTAVHALFLARVRAAD
ncbi:pyridoxal 5'-phosphate synthase glutaminase subunit PdxT [Brevibacterium samyangense]|uniref:Pyridoxal 5'-phosphate synthase subunit PdxT n=1 Tax=Brevibacterium samyangense TaxID=366888 RepID=A0ABN2T970_9MICO